MRAPSGRRMAPTLRGCPSSPSPSGRGRRTELSKNPCGAHVRCSAAGSGLCRDHRTPRKALPTKGGGPGVAPSDLLPSIHEERLSPPKLCGPGKKNLAPPQSPVNGGRQATPSPFTGRAGVGASAPPVNGGRNDGTYRTDGTDGRKAPPRAGARGPLSILSTPSTLSQSPFTWGPQPIGPSALAGRPPSCIIRLFTVSCGYLRHLGANPLGDQSPSPPGIYRLWGKGSAPGRQRGRPSWASRPLLPCRR